MALGGVRLDTALAALRRIEPGARACWIYDVGEVERRARRFRQAFEGLRPLAAYALKANPLPELLETIRSAGLGAEAGSLGELEIAQACGFAPESRVLNGNGRSADEARWVAERGVHSVNADHVGELDLLEREAARAGRTVRVALRVNPDVATPNHPHIATGHAEAKFGVGPTDALAAWTARERWPHLLLDGVHVHVGSQLLTAEPLEQAASTALELADEAARRGAPLGLVNLGGGFGVDYSGAGHEFPLERYAGWIDERARGRGLTWVLEPGRWLVATAGALVCEVLAVKQRGRQRFVVLSAGLNDLLRPALYGARHRIVALAPRAGAAQPADVVGPVCESADGFATAVPLPPLEPGDPIAILDTGAYGAVMSSNYNGRGRLAELVARDGTLTRVRFGERPLDLLARRTNDRLDPMGSP
jgi:diaminopimelate decarboxylase